MNKFFFDRSLLPAGCTVLCAVSGGADSVCLLDAARKLGDVTVLCAHFDHSIRGEESRRDAEFVRALCEKWNVPFFLGRGDVPAYAARHGESIETAARELRYEFLRRTARENGADRIATAHNLNDNAETILFRMARGTGLHGLTGIPAQRDGIVRPLLKTPRSAIEEYLRENGLSHVEDSTNALPDAARNRIRLNFLPELESIHPGAAESISRMTETLSEDEAYLEKLAREASEHWVGKIPCAELLSLPKPIARRAAAQVLGGEISFERGEALLRFAAGEGAGVLELPGRKIRRESGMLFPCEETLPPLEEKELVPDTGVVYPKRWSILCTACKNVREIQSSFNTFCFSCVRICGKLTVTSAADGDKITLRGRKGTRSVRKLLSEEAKIPFSERSGIPVVRDEAGPLAVYGIGQSERAFPAPGETYLKVVIRPILEEEHQ